MSQSMDISIYLIILNILHFSPSILAMLLFIDIEGDGGDKGEYEDGGYIIINIMKTMLNTEPTSELGIEGFASLSLLCFKKPNWAIPAS